MGAAIEKSNPNISTSQDLELHSESSDDDSGCNGGEENVEDPFTVHAGAEQTIKEEKNDLYKKKIK